MKKITSILAAGALALSFNAGAFTTAGATNNIRDYCRATVDAGFYDTIGACHSAINKSQVEFCKAYWDFFGFKNQGQCVKALRDSLNDFKKA